MFPKPGATDGSYIITGSANNVYTMTPGKKNSLKCDRACINAKSNICEHVLDMSLQLLSTLVYCTNFQNGSFHPILVSPFLTWP